MVLIPQELNVEQIRQLLEYPKIKEVKTCYSFNLNGRTLLNLLYAVELAQWYKVKIEGIDSRSTMFLIEEAKRMINKLNNKFLCNINIENIIEANKLDKIDILLKDYSCINVEK